jgi:hypothetical protein
MCFGGGNSAAKAAQEAEAQRQAGISANVAQINQAFKGRGSQYGDLGAALRQQYGTDLARQQALAARKTRFSLARGGLTGGSAAIDAGRLLNREAAQGTLQAEAKARGGVADLQAQDEAARLRMISLAQSGGDIGNAAMQTASALRANAESARSTGLATGLGDVFGATAATYKAQQDAAERRRGLMDASIYGKPFGAM